MPTPIQPGLCTGNFDFFRALRKHFWFDDKVKAGVHQLVQTHKHDFLFVGIKSVMYHWYKCSSLSGYYVQKQAVCPLTIFVVGLQH